MNLMILSLYQLPGSKAASLFQGGSYPELLRTTFYVTRFRVLNNKPAVCGLDISEIIPHNSRGRNCKIRVPAGLGSQEASSTLYTSFVVFSHG